MLLDKDSKELVKAVKRKSEQYSMETASMPGPYLAYLVAGARQATLEEMLNASIRKKHEQVRQKRGLGSFL